MDGYAMDSWTSRESEKTTYESDNAVSGSLCSYPDTPTFRWRETDKTHFVRFQDTVDL